MKKQDYIIRFVLKEAIIFVVLLFFCSENADTTMIGIENKTIEIQYNIKIDNNGDEIDFRYSFNNPFIPGETTQFKEITIEKSILYKCSGKGDVATCENSEINLKECKKQLIILEGGMSKHYDFTQNQILPVCQ
jgi:hypothetical protein